MKYRFKKNNLIFKPRGNTILLAMLIMSTILTVSVATSKLIVNEVKQSSMLDKSIIAFYASESGLEKSLYQIRKLDIEPDDINQTTENLSNNSAFNLIVRGDEEVVNIDFLEEDETYQLDLFNPGSFNQLDETIKSLIIGWEGAGSWLEIRWMIWGADGTISEPEGDYISVANSPKTINLFTGQDNFYRLRIITRKQDANNIQIRAYNQIDPTININCDPLSSCQVNIPERISVKSIGEYPVGSVNASKQAIFLSMPARPPLSGLYDFVLFSEGELKKED